ncbi:MAG: hypothetical protein M1821_000368 [Bathelium mastoideum]|nr:MAG: hypothetical protein M1821_000368 [Bathelium mastoideum]
MSSMELFDQLFDVNGGQGGDPSTIHNSSTTLDHGRAPTLPPSQSFQPVNHWPEDPAWFDLTPAEKSNPFDSDALYSQANNGVKPSNVEAVPGQRPKVITNAMRGARQHYGQITPPDDDTPDFKPTFDLMNHAPLQQSSTFGVEFAPSPDSPTTGDKQSDTNSAPSAPAESAPKKRKRGRKITKLASGDGNPEEEQKREKFLERNRVAASKCRQRKKEWMGGLEARARELQTQRTHLSAYVASLRDELLYLRDEMLKHNNCGCTKIREYLNGQAEVMSPSVNLHQLMTNLPASIGDQSLSPSQQQQRDLFAPPNNTHSQESSAFGSPLSGKTEQELQTMFATDMPQDRKAYC